MVKQLRKTRMQKRYNYQRNRKRMQKHLEDKGRIKETLIKEEWQKGKSLSVNLNEMGLVFDSNKSFGIPNARNERKKVLKLINGFYEEDIESEPEVTTTERKPKQHVADILEQESKEYVPSRFRLPKGIVKEVCGYIDKYGLNYKAMVRDPKNYNQDTWRQIREKVRKFMSIPDQFGKYLEEKGLLDGEIDETDPKWKEYETDDD